MRLELQGDQLIRKLAGSAVDPAFERALMEAGKTRLIKQQGWASAFVNAFADSDNRNLAPYFVSPVHFLERDATLEEVEAWLDRKVSSTLDQNLSSIRLRVQALEIEDASVRLLPDEELIEVQLPGVTDAKRVGRALTLNQKLEFWKASSYGEFFPVFEALNEQSKRIDSVQPYVFQDTSFFGPSEEVKKEQFLHENPFYAMFSLELMASIPEFVYNAFARPEDTARINRYMQHPEMQAILGERKMLWMEYDIPDHPGHLAWICLEGEPVMDGTVITRALADLDPYGFWTINLEMNSEGAETWARFTRNNVDNSVAIVLDDVILSVPKINGEIPGGRTQISGNFTMEEAKDLAGAIGAGGMETGMRIVESKVFEGAEK